MDEEKTSYVVSGRELAVSILRFTVGIDMLMHGIARFVDTPLGVAHGMTRQFQNTDFPVFLVFSFGFCLPFIETALGVLITLGLFSLTWVGLGALEMAALIFGTAWRRDYHLVSEQLIYAIVYFLILYNIEYNRYSLDRLLGRDSQG